MTIYDKHSHQCKKIAYLELGTHHAKTYINPQKHTSSEWDQNISQIHDNFSRYIVNLHFHHFYLQWSPPYAPFWGHFQVTHITCRTFSIMNLRCQQNNLWTWSRFQAFHPSLLSKVTRTACRTRCRVLRPRSRWQPTPPRCPPSASCNPLSCGSRRRSWSAAAGQAAGEPGTVVPTSLGIGLIICHVIVKLLQLSATFIWHGGKIWGAGFNFSNLFCFLSWGSTIKLLRQISLKTHFQFYLIPSFPHIMIEFLHNMSILHSQK